MMEVREMAGLGGSARAAKISPKNDLDIAKLGGKAGKGKQASSSRSRDEGFTE
jgi:hypothetical protein